MLIKMSDEWKDILSDEFAQPYFSHLSKLLTQEYSTKKIYPPRAKIFRAFELCPPKDLKIIIIGQDPYHTEGQANGLAFAVNKNNKLPPSLRNIFKEIQSDLGRTPNTDKDLLHWANQGILLINSTLTVEANKPGSHQNLGWGLFTDAVIKKIATENQNLVFMLWGNHAKKKSDFINNKQHLILTASHPSPLSASQGFFGCRHFSQANRHLEIKNKKPIDW